MATKFEQSKKDADKKSNKEGGKKDMAMDKKQTKSMPMPIKMKKK